MQPDDVRVKNPEMGVWRNLCQLERKGFLQKRTIATSAGKVTEFWPAGVTDSSLSSAGPEGWCK